MNSWSLFGRKPQPIIALARTDDAAALATLHATGFERGWDTHEFERLLADRLVIGHIARPGGRGSPTGFVLSRLVVGEAEILTVVVAPSARKAGLATALMQHHLGRLAGLGAKKVFLEVAEDNGAAIRLYQRYGFSEIGRRNAYYARAGRPAAAAIVMERVLA